MSFNFPSVLCSRVTFPLCVGMGKLRMKSGGSSIPEDPKGSHVCMAPTQDTACWVMYAVELCRKPRQQVGADVLGCRWMRYWTLICMSQGKIFHPWHTGDLNAAFCHLRLVSYISSGCIESKEGASHTCKIMHNICRPQSLLLCLIPGRLNTQSYWPPLTLVDACLSWYF